MADDDQPLQLIDHADPDAGFPLLDSTSATSSSSSSFVPPPPSDGLQSPKLESTDEYRLLPPGTPAAAPPKFNFRKQKRHRVMQSCVACHTQKRKVRESAPWYPHHIRSRHRNFSFAVGVAVRPKETLYVLASLAPEHELFLMSFFTFQ